MVHGCVRGRDTLWALLEDELGWKIPLCVIPSCPCHLCSVTSGTGPNIFTRNACVRGKAHSSEALWTAFIWLKGSFCTSFNFTKGKLWMCSSVSDLLSVGRDCAFAGSWIKQDQALGWDTAFPVPWYLALGTCITAAATASVHWIALLGVMLSEKKIPTVRQRVVYVNSIEKAESWGGKRCLKSKVICQKWGRRCGWAERGTRVSSPESASASPPVKECPTVLSVWQKLGRMRGRFLTPSPACLQLCRAPSVALCLENQKTTSSFNPHGRDSQQQEWDPWGCLSQNALFDVLLLSPPGYGGGGLGTPGARRAWRVAASLVSLSPRSSPMALDALSIHQDAGPPLKLSLFKQLVLHRLLPGPWRVETLLPLVAPRLFHQL